MYALLRCAWSSPLWTGLMSGVCLMLITFPYFGLAVFPGLVLFIQCARLARGPLQAAFLGASIGFMKAVGALVWLWATYPVVWASASAGKQITFIGLFWSSSALFLGIGLAVTSLGIWLLASRSLWFRVGSFPFLWVMGEIAGSFMLSVVLLGPGSSLNAQLTYGFIGLALGRWDMMHAPTVLAGVYGLTFVVAAIGVLLYGICRRDRSSASNLLILTTALVLASIWTSRSVPVGSGRVVVAVETDFAVGDVRTPEGYRYKQREVVAATTAALKTKPDIILLPEDSRMTTSFSTPDATLEHLRSLDHAARTLVVDTSRVDLVNGTAVLRAFYYDIPNNVVATTDKQFLVPQGEYVTYLFDLLLRHFAPSELVETLKRDQNYIPGHTNDVPYPRMLFCFESASGIGALLSNARSNTDLILHPVSHARFHTPRLMWYQLDTMLLIQSIWNKTPIVSAGNMAPSLMYRPDGTIDSGSILLQQERWRLRKFIY